MNQLTLSMQNLNSIGKGSTGEAQAYVFLVSLGFTFIVPTPPNMEGIDFLAMPTKNGVWGEADTWVAIDVKTFTNAKSNGTGLTETQKTMKVKKLNFRPYLNSNPLECFAWQNHRS